MAPTSSGEGASEGASPARAGAQRPQETSAKFARQRPFTTAQTAQFEVAGNTVFVRRYGEGPAILLVHGFPHFPRPVPTR